MLMLPFTKLVLSFTELLFGGCGALNNLRAEREEWLQPELASATSCNDAEGSALKANQAKNAQSFNLLLPDAELLRCPVDDAMRLRFEEAKRLGTVMACEDASKWQTAAIFFC